MFALHLFGGVRLIGPDGAIVGRAVQKRRVALLARLVLSPGRTASRDKLIGVLWPDSSTEQARHLLSVSLHELRRALGEKALEARGDDITLSSEVLSSDVEAFESAIASGDLERAVALYAGPFMDGFFASDAADLDAWIEQERTRLARTYAGTLERLARAAGESGDVGRSGEFWRRVAALDPYNGRIARELMCALDAAGDRAAALQHARIHAALLESEFGTQPDADLLALTEKMRAFPAPVAAAPSSQDRAADRIQTSPLAAEIGALTPVPANPTTGAQLPILPGRIGVRRRWIALGFVVLVLLLVSRPWGKENASPANADTPPSIAVLPFRSLSSSDTLQYFGDGLSEEIISSLGRVTGLHVAASTSSFLLRDTVDVRDVAERLNVRTVLEGTVRVGGNRVMVTASLIDARERKAIWSDKYDRDWNMQDILTIQEEIARSVVRALSVRLVQDTSRPRLVTPTTSNVQAFDHYLSGRPHFHRRTPESVSLALLHFQRAVEQDPQYALAYAGIADAYLILGAHDYGVMAPREAFPKAKDAAQRALRLDPNLAEAHAALGTILFNFDHDWTQAERELMRAIDLHPGYSQAFHWYSFLLAAQRRLPEARAAVTRAREVDPLSPVIATSYARHLYFAGELERSVEEYRKVLEADSSFIMSEAGIGLAFVALQRYDSAIAHYNAAGRKMGTRLPVFIALEAHAHGLAGHTEDALRGLAVLKEIRAKRYVPHEYFTLAYLGLGDRERALDHLEAAREARSGGIIYLQIEPVLNSLRGHPRFVALVAAVGLK